MEAPLAQKTIHPKLGHSSFSCPRCGTLAHQTWYKLRAEKYQKDFLPHVPDESAFIDYENISDPSVRVSIKSWATRMLSGDIFFDSQSRDPYSIEVNNLNLSICYSCNEPTVWVADKILFPKYEMLFEPNEDMPEAIAADFREANNILRDSPRGAAALLRLCIQNLMIHLGESGDKINNDIKSLVGKGLDLRIQRSLDLVRVIGNNAVHPGEINWKDNPEVATKLFGLVNYIVEDRISRPKEIDKLYDENLTDDQKTGIENRDKTKRD